MLIYCESDIDIFPCSNGILVLRLETLLVPVRKDVCVSFSAIPRNLLNLWQLKWGHYQTIVRKNINRRFFLIPKSDLNVYLTRKKLTKIVATKKSYFCGLSQQHNCLLRRLDSGDGSKMPEFYLFIIKFLTFSFHTTKTKINTPWMQL